MPDQEPNPPEFADVLASVDGVEGWMSPDQARRLYDAAARTTAGDRIVEIGSFRGRSTIVLASAAPAGVEIIAIDPHAGNDRGPQEIEGFVEEAADDHATFVANLSAAGVSDRVRHIRSFSDRAHDDVIGAVAVVYVDGAHRYGPARTDIRDWGRRVDDGGTMLIHDSFSSVGVTLALMRELALGRRFRYVGRARSLTEYCADLDGSALARIANAGRQVLQLPWFVRNLLIKVLMTCKLDPVVRVLTRRPAEWPY